MAYIPIGSTSRSIIAGTSSHGYASTDEDNTSYKVQTKSERLKQNIIEYSILTIFGVLLFLGAIWVENHSPKSIYPKINDIELKLNNLITQISEQENVQQNKLETK
jgi:hypothetical protein